MIITKKELNLILFQSTRPRGARLETRNTHSIIFCFNPRAREGRDRCADNILPPRAVSIHAPARGATTSDYKVALVGGSFNPRAREGRDQLRRRRAV